MNPGNDNRMRIWRYPTCIFLIVACIAIILIRHAVANRVTPTSGAEAGRGAPTQEPRYTVRPLPDTPGRVFHPQFLNDNGQIAGVGYPKSDHQNLFYPDSERPEIRDVRNFQIAQVSPLAYFGRAFNNQGQFALWTPAAHGGVGALW